MRKKINGFLWLNTYNFKIICVSFNFKGVFGATFFKSGFRPNNSHKYLSNTDHVDTHHPPHPHLSMSAFDRP